MKIAPQDPIILVSGFGRCGTSLVMQMLSAAGIDCTGLPPTWEEKPPKGADAAYWVEHYAGRAIKVLDPHRLCPPKGPAYRVIWLDRNIRQQALSHLKFLRALRLADPQMPDKVIVKKFEKSLIRDRPRATSVLRGLAGEENCYNLRFEDIINAPHVAAKQIFDAFSPLAEDLARGSDDYARAVLRVSSVIKFRHPDNYPGILELTLPGMADIPAKTPVPA
jgi:hypothetical protein